MLRKQVGGDAAAGGVFGEKGLRVVGDDDVADVASGVGGARGERDRRVLGGAAEPEAAEADGELRLLPRTGVARGDEVVENILNGVVKKFVVGAFFFWKLIGWEGLITGI